MTWEEWVGWTLLMIAATLLQVWSPKGLHANHEQAFRMTNWLAEQEQGDSQVEGGSGAAADA
jgi:hypothetical protein